MGQLVSSSIPNCISGVSQQPWNVRLPSQAEEQINCFSSVSDFLKRRPATRHVAKITGETADDLFLHAIDRDSRERYLVLVSRTGVRVFTLEGKEMTVRLDGSAKEYLAAAESPATDFRAQTINDYTFLLNRRVTVRADETSLTPKREPEALVFIKQASYNTTYTVTLDDGAVTASFTTLDGVAPADQPADELSSTQITVALRDQINAHPDYEAQATNATLWIRRRDRGEFKVKVEDTRSNTHTALCKGTTQRFSDLLTVAPRGFVTEVVGDSSSSFDNYYVRFEPLDGKDDFGPGVWKETVAPGIPHKLDAATLPHALIRQADGTFSFGPLEWEERTCGDEDSAPLPSFVGSPLNGIFFYRNRLAFLAGDNVVMSETGEFFNFFVTTVTTLVDSDPIDVAASTTRSSLLQHAVVFTGGILLFSDQAQFSLEHDTVLANSTVSVKPVTEFACDMTTPPVSSGKTVFFAVNRGQWGGIREYYTMPDNTDQNDAADVSSHVPHYIAGGIYRLVCSSNEDYLLVLSRGKRDSLWLYKYFWNGSEKLQSAWSRWDMAGSVVGAALFDARIFLLMSYPGDGLYLEDCDISPAFCDDGEDFEYSLDRKLTEAQCEVLPYDKTTESTTILLPYTPATMPTVVTRSGEGQRAGFVFETEALRGNRLTLRGDASGKRLFIGLPYTSRYVFSPFALREQGKGNAVTSGRLQLRSLSLACERTGYLEVEVSAAFRQPSLYRFTGRELGHGTNRIGSLPLYTGSIRVPLLSLNTQASVALVSDSFLPFSVVNASWEGFYTTRNRQA